MTTQRLVTGDAFEGIRAQRNYLNNSSFELGLLKGWATYADAAATTPVDGTGGSPNVTFAIQSGNLIRNAFCARLTKDAANRQGQGASFDFTIDAADKSKTLLITFDFIASANYAANDIGVYIYDVTNATLITPAQVNIPAGTGSINSFFVATTSTSYRLILHVASTNASSYTLDVDNFFVGNGSLGVGYAGTDFTAYTPASITGYTTSSAVYEWARAGDRILIRGRFVTASTAASAASFTLPPGITAKSTTLQTAGSWTRSSAGSSTVKIGHLYSTNNSNVITFASGNYATTDNPQGAINGNLWGGAGEVIIFETWAVINEWSSNVTMADRQVEEYAYTTGTWDADDSTTAYGPAGVQMSGSLTGARNKTVTFQSPIQATDTLIVELAYNANPTAWFSAPQLSPYTRDSTDSDAASAGCYISSTTTTTAVIRFCRYFGIANDDSPVSNWSTSYRWRVRKVSSGGMVGFPIASSNIMCRTDGLAPSAGYLGETTQATGSTSGSSSSGVTTAQITLQPGSYLIYGQTSILNSSGTLTSGEYTSTITSNSALNPATTDFYANIGAGSFGGGMTITATNTIRNSSFGMLSVEISTTTTYYIRTAYSTVGGGSVGIVSLIRAIRKA